MPSIRLKTPAFNRATGLIALLGLALIPGWSADLEEELGRNEVRVYSAAIPSPIGWSVVDSSLLQRLEDRGYRRVHHKPTTPGDFFFGESIFWVYRRAFRIGSEEHSAALFGMTIGSDSVITDTVGSDRTPIKPHHAQLEPLLLSESLDADRAPRISIHLNDLPEHVWQPVLAIEDHRFFEHHGVDGKAIARALLKNLKKGRVAEGGSTITQQLVKNRDLSPKRSLGRKANEAVRALSLESEYSKEEILQAYLNTIYMGHVDGVGVYGFGAAAQVYFSVPVARLDLGRAAALAALIQAPNRLHPERHPDRLKERRNVVINRMVDLEWIEPRAAAAAQRTPLGIHISNPKAPKARSFIRWTAELATAEAPKRVERGKGVVIESTLDPMLQNHAEDAVRDGLRLLRRRRGLTDALNLQAALVCLDPEAGDVLAYVTSDPSHPDVFDRARTARRQPGSLIKPLLLLEAFQSCGHQKRLHPASRIADTPITIELPSGDWSPDNPDDRFRGTVEIRDALTQSLNVPFVKIARHCGFPEMATRVRETGIPVPESPPPSFVLGSIEGSPLEIVHAYTVFATPGSTLQPRPVHRISRPSGRGLERFGVKKSRVTSKTSAYLVGWLLEQAVQSGTAEGVQVPGLTIAAKTGTSSDGRDAWLVGFSGSVVTVVWVGRDDNRPMGLSGSSSAAPIWRQFMAVATKARPARETPRPRKIREAYVDPETGLRVRSAKDDARSCLFRKGSWPHKDRRILRDKPEPVLD